MGTDRLISINGLVALVAAIAGKTIRKQHDLTKPQGVRGRNSDNTRLREAPGSSRSKPVSRARNEWIAEKLHKKGASSDLQMHTGASIAAARAATRLEFVTLSCKRLAEVRQTYNRSLD